jgi:hypothetical protein
MKAFNQRGEGKGGLIFGLLVLFLFVYAAIKVVPVMIKVYAYEDAVREECKFLRHRTNEQLTEDLVTIATNQELPVAPGDISISKYRDEDHQTLKVTIDYTVPISTPVKVFNWDQHIVYEAPVFE